MTVYTDLLEAAVAEGSLSQEDYDAIDRILNPGPPRTFEEALRREMLEALTNLVLYGQTIPPKEPQILEGIRPIVVDWMPEGVALVSADPVESIRAAIEKIQHDPLWSLDRPRG